MSGPAPNCVVLGGGGHARVVMDAIMAEGAANIMAVLDPNPDLWNKRIMGVPVAGGDDLLEELAQKGADSFVVGLGSVGDARPRQRLFQTAAALGLTPLKVVHPAAVISKWAETGPGTVALAGGIVNTGARLGSNVIVNTGALVEHDCLVGDHAHLATGCRLAGGVKVGEGAHIGAGAVVREAVSIGAGALVGAGAVVIDEVAPGAKVAGVPARII
ncbi:MAG: NeuD/PglB/VioB family sugar acetyltransferase [Desulfarculaceae bacterium]